MSQKVSTGQFDCKQVKLSHIGALKIFLLCLLLSFLTVSRLAHSQESIKIGAILHLTGDYAMQGQAFREGIELAVEEVNTKGGVESKLLELIVEDAQYNTKLAHSIAKKMLEIDGVQLGIISTLHETKAAGGEFEKNKVPLMVLWDSCPELDAMGEYIFGIGPWAPSTGAKAAQYSFSKLGAKSAAILSTQNEWSLSVSKTFEEHFLSLGGKITRHITVNPGDLDFKTVLAKIKFSKPSVIYAPVADGLIPFFKQAKEMHVEIPIITSDNINDELLKTSALVFEGAYQTQAADPDFEETQVMRRNYEKKFSKSLTLPFFVAWGYDAVKLYALAIKKGGINPENIKTSLYKIKNYNGATGLINFNAQGSSPKLVSMFQVKNGELALVDR